MHVSSYVHASNALLVWGALCAAQVTSAKAHHALLQYDSRPDGRVDLDEFAALVQHLGQVGTTNHPQPSLSHPPVAAAAEPSPTILGAFRKFDLNGSGYLEYDELRMALAHYGIDVSSQAALSVLLSYDSSRDGRLDFEEVLTVSLTHAPTHSLTYPLTHPPTTHSHSQRGDGTGLQLSLPPYHLALTHPSPAY